MTSAVSVEVQNHSPNDFFLASLMFQMSDGRKIFAPRDFATGEHLTDRKIEPGNNFSFIVDPVELAAELKGQELTVVVARDKIDRRFQSRPGELAAALSTALNEAISRRDR